MSKVHIIGAGLAGLAAAVKLTKAGKQVILYEAAPQAGGRCRSYFDTELGCTLDNGNHLILGANGWALSYMDAINATNRFNIRQKPHYLFVDVSSGERWNFKASWVFWTLLKLVLSRHHQTVSDCIRPDSALYRQFVDPFCTSVLNTEPAYASAVMMCRTLLEILRSGRKAMHTYLPITSLSDSLIDPALAHIKASGGVIHYNKAVKSLRWQDDNVAELQFADDRIDLSGDAVILATPAHIATKLLPKLTLPSEYNAIVNGHFLCPEFEWNERDDFIGVTGGMAQWIFYRSGVISTTTSAANILAAQDNEFIARMLWKDICAALKINIPLPRHRIICEKRATLAATPFFPHALQKHYGNCFLAGDYTQHDWPATIDSAVKSGCGAAEKCLAYLSPLVEGAA